MAQAEPLATAAAAAPAASNTKAHVALAADERPGEYCFQPLVSYWLLLLLPLLFLLAVKRAYARSTRKLVVPQQFWLGLLRLGTLALLLLCLGRPVRISHAQLREKSMAFVVLDHSSSMNLRDVSGGRTRWEQAALILSANADRLKKLESQVELRRYSFSAGARPAQKLPGEESGGALRPDGLATDLCSAFEQLGQDAAGVPSVGAVLLSDGRHNLPKDVITSALGLAQAGVPLYVIGLGQDATPADHRDIKIRQLIVPEKAFVGSETTVGIEIESSLSAPQSSTLLVEIDGKKLQQKKINLPAGSNVPHPLIELPYVPDRLGIHRVTALLSPLPQEANIVNNTTTAFFRVFRNRIGVWYVEGAVRPEFGKLRTALETAPNLSFKALNAFTASTVAPEELLPNKEDDWRQTRLIIIGDLAASRFDPEGLQRLARFVAEGGALLMIGGFNTFGQGGWQHSAVAEILPVEMHANDPLLDTALTINIPSEQRAHPILKLGDTAEQNAQLWAKLPSLPGINTFAGVRPLGQVLLKAGSRELLVVQEYGKGRSGVFAADMTWQWILKAGQGESHKSFWRNLVTWLTRSDYRDTSKAVFADSDRLHYLVGEEALFAAHVYETEASATQLQDARVTISLCRLEGQRQLPLLQEEVGRGKGDYARRFALGSAGTYRFSASAFSTQGTLIDSDSIDLHVTAPDLESDNPRANLKLLRRLASLTGGLYFDPDKAAQAFDSLLARPTGYSKSVSEVSELWSSWWMLLAFLCTLTLEWSLRRRWGLI